MKVNILGTDYTIEYRKPADDSFLQDLDGYVDTSIHLIVVEDMQPEKQSKKDLEVCKKQVLRHEIIHAFLFESGLDSSSGRVQAWAVNEEMVDWIALQFTKIQKAFQECDCIEIEGSKKI